MRHDLLNNEMRTESVTAKYEKCDDQLQSEIRHGCQMAIVRVLDCMQLALQACRTMAVLYYAAKFDLIWIVLINL